MITVPFIAFVIQWIIGTKMNNKLTNFTTKIRWRCVHASQSDKVKMKNKHHLNPINPQSQLIYTNIIRRISFVHTKWQMNRANLTSKHDEGSPSLTLTRNHFIQKPSSKAHYLKRILRKMRKTFLWLQDIIRAPSIGILKGWQLVFSRHSFTVSICLFSPRSCSFSKMTVITVIFIYFCFSATFLDADERRYLSCVFAFIRDKPPLL